MSLLERTRAALERHPLVDAQTAVHVHLFHFRALLPHSAELSVLLGADERRRAGAFHFPELAARFRCGRGALRWLLGGYLREPAAELTFTYSPHGKPAVLGTALQFSVSHTRNLLVMAFARGVALGADVEEERSGVQVECIAEQFFAAAEHAKLIALPPPERPRAFLRCWTQKEAYLKARGTGLSAGLDEVEMAVLPEEPCGFSGSGVSPAGSPGWCFFETELPPAAHLTVAVERPGSDFHFWRWVDGGADPGPERLWVPASRAVSRGISAGTAGDGPPRASEGG